MTTNDAMPAGVWSGREAHQARRLGVVLGLTAAFVSFELAGAVFARSQVLLADGLHLLLDVFALALSMGAMRLAVRAPSERFPFGLRRVEPLAAVFNGGLVVAVACGIVAESVADLREPGEPRPTVMLVVAAAALVVHGISAWLIHDAMHGVAPGLHDHEPHDHDEHGEQPHAPHTHAHGHGHALNLRGVWLHLVGDLLGSVTALVAATVIGLGGPARVDAIGSLVVAVILFGAAAKLLRDAVLVLLDAAPAHLPIQAVREAVLAEPGVVAVVELRVWTVGAGHDAATVTVRSDGTDAGLAGRVRSRLHDQLGVELVTVEVTT